MAKSSLLNTNTANVVELIGNGKVFSVPQYQRDYSWSEEQWDDLWSDIVELSDKPDDSHYMGALVVEAKTDRAFEIIDGQQRLATLSVIALAVIDRLNFLTDAGIDPESNRERSLALRNRFIGEKDPASLVESSKLTLNQTNNDFYQDYLVQLRPPINPRGLNKSNKLLWEAFGFFKQKIANHSSWQNDGRKLATLLAETVGRQLLFIRIAVDDELNAYTVFETLNARGLELTATDLLKNYLFSKVPLPGDRAVLQRRWQSLIDRVGASNFPEFLRYHLLCELPKVRTQRLFKIVRDRVRRPEQVFELLDLLDPRAELFSALRDPTHGYWQEHPDAKPYVKELTQFRVRQMTPLLFAAWEKFQSDDFVRVLKLVSTVSFRYTVISSLNTNSLEPVYHEAAKAVLTGRALRPGAVFSILKQIYVPDETFIANFSTFQIGGNGQGRKLAKYLLCKLETHVSGRPCDPETDTGTIEHILPENPSQHWSATFPSDRWEQAIDRLGNLSLLEPTLNREIGSADYKAKIIAYGRSKYQITKDVAVLAPEEWTPAHLEKRQAEFAQIAAKVWRSDFA